MAAVIRAVRSSAVLKRSSLACLGSTPAVNLTSGCAHGCLYCYARGYITYPGHNKVVVYANVPRKLQAELSRKRPKPTAVYFSPSSDIFQPVPEVRELCHSVLDFLLAEGVGVAFVTKGQIPDRTMDLLLRHPDKVRAQIGIITLNEAVWRTFEPNTLNPRLRIEQMKTLVAGGIATEARIMPVLPGLTDDPVTIDHLLRSISEVGVRIVAMSTLFLRPAIIASLKRGVPDQAMVENLLSLYRGVERLATRAEDSYIIALPLQIRQEVYARMRQMASKYSLDLSVCGCMNTDIDCGTCNIAGRWPAPVVQPSLFDRGE